MRNDRDTAHVLATSPAPEHDPQSQAAAGLASRGSSASAQVSSPTCQFVVSNLGEVLTQVAKHACWAITA